MRSIWCALAMATALAWPCAAAGAEDTQHGERVLPANQSPRDAPLARHAKALWFDISNLRRAKEGFREVFFDYRHSNADVALNDVIVVIRTPNKRDEFQPSFKAFREKKGTLKALIESGFIKKEEPLEIYFEQKMGFGSSQRMKISNSITLGNVGKLTYAREWTADEKSKFENQVKSATPPPPPPAGYALVSKDRQVSPGMPVLGGWMGAWQPAEVIAVQANGLLLINFTSRKGALERLSPAWVAVADKVLAEARSNPARFKPSIRVLPGSVLVIPDDHLPLPNDAEVCKGMPLKAEHARKWADAVVLDPGGGKLRVHLGGYPGGLDKVLERSEAIVTQATLDALQKPAAVEALAAALEKTLEEHDPARKAARSEAERARERAKFEEKWKENEKLVEEHKRQVDADIRESRLHRYPIRLPLPKGAVRVDEDTPLVEGTKLGICWGNRWHNATVLEVHDDGTVKIHWDDQSATWDDDVARDCLAIDGKVLAKLTAKTNATGKSSRPPKDEVATANPGTGKKPTAGKQKSVADADDEKPAGKKPAGKKPAADQFRVVLTSFGKHKVAVTKAVMEATGLDLADAKEFVESAPVTIKQNLKRSAADKLRKELEQAGATVTVEPQ